MANRFDRPPDDPGAPRQVTPQGNGPSMVSPGMGAKTGAKSVDFEANGREVFFTVKFRRDMSDDAGAESVNMAQLHYQLLEQMIKAADGVMEFRPTNKNVEKPPAPFRDLLKFPKTEFDHKNFFHRHEVRLRDQGITMMRISHCYFGTDEIASIKKKIRSFLDENSIFIDSEEIKANETTVIGWFLHAHASMTHCPTLTAIANEVLRNIPLDDDLKAHLKRLYPNDEEFFIPEVFASNRMVQFGNSMSVDAIALCCTRRTLGFLKKLVLLAPEGSFPYALIPIGFEKQCGPDSFARLVGNHNVFVHKLNSISVMYLHPSAWDLVIPNTQMTMRQQFEQSGYFHSIEVTESTARNGRHLLIVHADKYAEAERILHEFFRETFRHMTSATYLDHYQHWPHLQFVSNRNIDHQAKVDAIMARVEATEHSLALPTGSSAASTARPAPSLFDLSAMQAHESSVATMPNDTTSDAASASTPATTNTYSAAARGTRSSVRASIPQSDEVSTTGRSVAGRSVQSDAVSTIVSHFESVMSRQSEQVTAMMRQQSEFHRQQTEFQMRQAETTNKQMEMMLQMMSTMAHALPSLYSSSQSSVQTFASTATSVSVPASTPPKAPRPPPSEARKRSNHPVPSPARPGPNATIPGSPDRESGNAPMEDAQPPAPVPPPPAAPDPRNSRRQE